MPERDAFGASGRKLPVRSRCPDKPPQQRLPPPASGRGRPRIGRPRSRPYRGRPGGLRTGSPPSPPPRSIRPTVRRLPRSPRLSGPGPHRGRPPPRPGGGLPVGACRRLRPTRRPPLPAPSPRRYSGTLREGSDDMSRSAVLSGRCGATSGHTKRCRRADRHRVASPDADRRRRGASGSALPEARRFSNAARRSPNSLPLCPGRFHLAVFAVRCGVFPGENFRGRSEPPPPKSNLCAENVTSL